MLDTREEQDDWLDDITAPSTRQLDNGEDRPEGKQESFGWMTSHAPIEYKATG